MPKSLRRNIKRQRWWGGRECGSVVFGVAGGGEGVDGGHTMREASSGGIRSHGVG